MPYRPMVKTVNDDSTFYGNSLVFATKEEAERSARDLSNRWMLVTDWRADECDGNVNYRIDLETGEMSAVTVAPQAGDQLPLAL